jgi:hypothetical protein
MYASTPASYVFIAKQVKHKENFGDYRINFGRRRVA